MLETNHPYYYSCIILKEDCTTRKTIDTNREIEVITKLNAMNSLGACPRKMFELKVNWITNSQKLLQNESTEVRIPRSTTT